MWVLLLGVIGGAAAAFARTRSRMRTGQQQWGQLIHVPTDNDTVYPMRRYR